MLQAYYHIFMISKLCEGMSMEECEQALTMLEPVIRHFKKGEALFLEGGKQHCFGMVVEGEVLQSRMRNNGERALFELIQQGQLFGEIMMFLNPQPSWRCDILARTDCAVMLFSVKAFFGKAFQESEASGTVILNLLKRVCERFESMQVLLKSLKTQSVRQRISNFLYEKYLVAGDPNIKLGITRFELAEFLNLPRPSLSRELSAMRAEGIIGCVGDQILVKDLNKLMENM